MDEVFKALADPTRRSLLDELFREDGQTLTTLQERFAMTRFGVMKHLKVLEEAGLVVTKRRGREKLHFLNPIPIRLVHDRWVSKYAEPWAAGLTGLKSELEKTMEETMEKVFEIYIKTTPERLWQAITDSEIRSKYQFGGRITSDWTTGSSFRMGHPNGSTLLGEGVNLEVDPPRRLVQNMVALWGDDVKSEGTSRITWEIEPVGDSCRLTVTHDQLREGANEQLYGGWPMILSGPQDLAGDGRAPHHAGIPDVYLRAGRGRHGRPARALRPRPPLTDLVLTSDEGRPRFCRLVIPVLVVKNSLPIQLARPVPRPEFEAAPRSGGLSGLVPRQRIQFKSRRAARGSLIGKNRSGTWADQPGSPAQWTIHTRHTPERSGATNRAVVPADAAFTFGCWTNTMNPRSMTASFAIAASEAPRKFVIADASWVGGSTTNSMPPRSLYAACSDSNAASDPTRA